MLKHLFNGKKGNSEIRSEKPLLNEKEDELLRLVASYVQSLLKNDTPDR
jgi:hypothetical protein